MKKSTIILLTLALGVTFSVDASMRKEMRQEAPRRTLNVKPVVTPATNITENSFTANWVDMAGADGYCVFVYEPIPVMEAGTYTVLEESFNLVNLGSTVEPYWHEGFSCTLDEDYDFTFTPDWTVIGAAFARGMVSGNVYTPTTDLTHNNGKYRVILDIVGQKGTKIKVTSYGATVESQEQICEGLGESTLTFDFTNGNHETYLYIVDNGNEYASDQQQVPLSYLDNFAIQQDLNAGDQFLRLITINDGVDAPASSCDFANMKFLNGAKNLCYDLYAAYFTYDDPDDPWNYDVDYSEFSDLMHLTLANGDGVDDITTDADAATEVYNLAGQRIATSTEGLDAGIYIVRQGNKTTKVAVK